MRWHIAFCFGPDIRLTEEWMQKCCREPSTTLEVVYVVFFSSWITCFSWLWVREEYQMRGQAFASEGASGAACASQEVRAAVARCWCDLRQPRLAHSRQSVLPVPVGDSNSAFCPASRAWITARM
mmetsp:Transcript_29403/g.78610  ORF Transcript_29403/g.78610 Transcript_29403/m.78610 type:complete len:125 (-) Transcript_29403:226-600(-)